jgi:hypothetical protein
MDSQEVAGEARPIGRHNSDKPKRVLMFLKLSNLKRAHPDWMQARIHQCDNREAIFVLEGQLWFGPIPAGRGQDAPRSLMHPRSTFRCASIAVRPFPRGSLSWLAWI